MPSPRMHFSRTSQGLLPHFVQSHYPCLISFKALTTILDNRVCWHVHGRSHTPGCQYSRAGQERARKPVCLSQASRVVPGRQLVLSICTMAELLQAQAWTSEEKSADTLASFTSYSIPPARTQALTPTESPPQWPPLSPHCGFNFASLLITNAVKKSSHILTGHPYIFCVCEVQTFHPFLNWVVCLLLIRY